MNEAKIFIFEESQLPDLEVRSMLSAFYSRSNQSIEDRLQELSSGDVLKIKESLKKYSIQYGHASIRDMATTTPIFIEGVSLLLAKAFEHSGQGNYQESSTRYLSFKDSGFVDSVNTLESKEIMNNWIAFYYEMQPKVTQYLYQRFIKTSTQKDEIYEKAIAARCFDITRSLLPAGIKTQLAMSMTFKALQEHLWQLTLHPLEEVSKLSQRLLQQLQTLYGYSFVPISKSQQDYYQQVIANEFYLIDYSFPFSVKNKLVINGMTELSSLSDNALFLTERPKGVMLPTLFNRFGTFHFDFTLDYGSWRDLQRHRYVLSNRCGLLGRGGALNFSSAYFHELPDFSESELKKLDTFLESQDFKIRALHEQYDVSPFNLQYFYPLGSTVRCELMVTLPQLMYILELRSGKSVHYTLRKKIHEFWKMVKLYLPDQLTHYVNEDPSEFYYERGQQDIIKQSHEGG